MDFKQIQELIKLVSKSNISEISIEEENFKITIKQKDHSGEGAPLVQPAYAMVPPVAAMPPLPSRRHHPLHNPQHSLHQPQQPHPEKKIISP